MTVYLTAGLNVPAWLRYPTRATKGLRSSGTPGRRWDVLDVARAEDRTMPFRKRQGEITEERMKAGYTACVQDEAICVADARLRKGVYTQGGMASTRTRDRTPRPVGLITQEGLEIQLLYRRSLSSSCMQVREDPDDNRLRGSTGRNSREASVPWTAIRSCISAAPARI